MVHFSLTISHRLQWPTFSTTNPKDYSSSFLSCRTKQVAGGSDWQLMYWRSYQRGHNSSCQQHLSLISTERILHFSCWHGFTISRLLLCCCSKQGHCCNYHAVQRAAFNTETVAFTESKLQLLSFFNLYCLIKKSAFDKGFSVKNFLSFLLELLQAPQFWVTILLFLFLIKPL